MPHLRICFVLACSLLLSLHSPQAFGADKTVKPPVPTVEDCLKTFGYIAIPLTRGVNNELRVAAQLAGKKKEFMVDTGWSLTTIDTSLRAKFKTPRELGVSVNDAVLGS